MNERIKELMGQTLDNKFSYTWTTMDYKDIEKFSEKFAELIVRECVVLVADAVDHREPASTYVSKIKEHFGVE